MKFLLTNLEGGFLATFFIALSRYVSDFSCIFGGRMRMYEMGLPGIASPLADRLPFLSPSLRGRVRVRKKGRKGRTEREHIILIDR